MEDLLKTEDKDTNIAVVLLSSIIAVIILLFAATQIGDNFTFSQILTFMINGVVIFIMFVKGLGRYRFSIDLVHSIFCLLFFWIAPIVQISTGFNAWGIKVGVADTVKANILILIWLVFYNIGSLLVHDYSFKIKEIDFLEIPKRPIICLWCLTICLTALVMIKNKFRIENISFSNSERQSVDLLVGHCAVAFFTFSTIITALWFKSNNYPVFFVVVSVVCLLLTCFPTSLSRYAAGSIYVCLLVNVCFWFQKKHRFMLLMTIGIIFMFPVMDLYRYRSIKEVSFSEIVNSIFSVKKYFNSGNYDAYQMLIVTIKYTEKYGVTYGRQLMGALLFFIPRQIWNTKPIGSGAYMAGILNLEFNNISCPIVGEAYINFGLIGIVVFAFMFGYFMKKIDNTYWAQSKGDFSYISLLYFYLLPYTFFLCRGDMMSTWAYLFANIVVLYFLVKILQKCVGDTKE